MDREEVVHREEPVEGEVCEEEQTESTVPGIDEGSAPEGTSADAEDNEEESRDDDKSAGSDHEGESSCSSAISNVIAQPLHPTKTKWTIWIETPGQQHANWIDGLKPVNTFGTIEDFWRLFNNIKLPSHLPKKSFYYMFRDGIKPQWEDAQNSNGGRWRIEIKDGDDMDRIWENSAIELVGECYPNTQEVCGIVAGFKKNNRIDIWTRNWNNKDACIGIGKEVTKHAKRNPLQATYQSYQDVHGKNKKAEYSLK